MDGEGEGFNGPARCCSCCGEVWPQTLDYFHASTRRGRIRWQSWCRACVAEWTAAKRWHLAACQPDYPMDDSPGFIKYHAGKRRQ